MQLQRSMIKVMVFIISLIPFLLLLNDTVKDQLGANPIQSLHFSLGDWALRFLCITLALRPIKILTGNNWPLRFRRMMGLFTFFYASLHLLVYIVLDQSLSWSQIKDEIPKSPYILVGLLAYIMLLPLALTSTKKMQKRLGKSWKKLHSTIYVIAIVATIHYFWLVKLDISQPTIYALVILVLLGIRIVDEVKKRRGIGVASNIHNHTNR